MKIWIRKESDSKTSKLNIEGKPEIFRKLDMLSSIDKILKRSNKSVIKDFLTIILNTDEHNKFNEQLYLLLNFIAIMNILRLYSDKPEEITTGLIEHEFDTLRGIDYIKIGIYYYDDNRKNNIIKQLEFMAMDEDFIIEDVLLNVVERLDNNVWRHIIKTLSSINESLFVKN